MLQGGPDGAVAGTIETLEACRERVRDEIRHQEAIEGFIAERLVSLDVIASGERPVVLTESPALYWTRLWLPQEEEEVEPVIPSEEEGFRIPFADSSLLLEEDLLGAGADIRHPRVGYAIERRYTREVPRGRHVDFLPSRHALRTIVEVDEDFSIEPSRLEGVLRRLHDDRLVVDGTPFTHRIITFYQDDAERRFDDLWVPVREGE